MQRAHERERAGGEVQSPPEAATMKTFEDRILPVLPRLHRYARSLCRNAADAEDLVHDSLEKAIASRHSWRGDNLAGWLMTIQTNVCRNRMRSARRQPEIVPADQAVDIDARQGENDPLESDRLMRALDQLHPDQRIVLMLVVIEGYRYTEVAEMLDVPLGTVMSRLSRARHRLGELLRGQNIVEFRRN